MSGGGVERKGEREPEAGSVQLAPGLIQGSKSRVRRYTV